MIQVMFIVVLVLLNHAPAVRALDSYPVPDAGLGEALHNNEVQHANNIAMSIESVLRERYEGQTILRDAHPKAHGCLAAEFKVSETLPPQLQHGVFSPGAQYSALVRFSNGSADAQRDDKKGDTRGMAIKLHDVGGDGLDETQSHVREQDFLLINFPAFFVNEASDYDEFFSIMNSGSIWRMWKLPFILGVEGSINAFKMLRGESKNPLTNRYFSAVPYQLGLGESRVAVKYSARHCSSTAATHEPALQLASNNDPDYLRKVLVDSVAKESACMEFMVQTAPPNSSVEDVVTRWPEDQSEFVVVAKMLFPPQVFDTKAQLQRCEAMSFNPWHGIAAHKPLGAVNRIRKLVYDRISALRASSVQ